MTAEVQVVEEDDCVNDLLATFQPTDDPTKDAQSSHGPTIEVSPHGTISRLHGGSGAIPREAFLPEQPPIWEVAPTGDSLTWALLDTWPCLLDPTGDGLPELYLISEEIRADRRIVQFKQEWAGLEVFGSSLTLFFDLDEAFWGSSPDSSLGANSWSGRPPWRPWLPSKRSPHSLMTGTHRDFTALTC